jgi:hypothetical protein
MGVWPFQACNVAALRAANTLKRRATRTGAVNLEANRTEFDTGVLQTSSVGAVDERMD